MVVKTQKRNKQLNKQRNKHSNKYTSTKKTGSKRTRKNNLVLQGGSQDVEIYYKKNVFSKIIASTIPNDSLKDIQYKKLSKMPEIKINKNGIYRIMFYCKDYQTQNTVSQQNPGSLFAEYQLQRSGILTHIIKKISEKTDGLKKILETYASINVQKALTIIVRIYNGVINKNTKVTTYEQAPNLTYYFNLKPTV